MIYGRNSVGFWKAKLNAELLVLRSRIHLTLEQKHLGLSMIYIMALR